MNNVDKIRHRLLSYSNRSQVHDYVVENVVMERSDSPRERYRIGIVVPYLATDRLVTLDHDKIDEKGCTVFAEEGYEEFDNHTIHKQKYGATWAISVLDVDPTFERSYYFEQYMQQIVGMICNVLRKGFITDDVVGYVEEPVEPVETGPTPISEYDPSEMGPTFETRERQYSVGTKRISIEGVWLDE